MKAINFIALILVLVGALNWGLWGFFQFDLVAYIFGGNTMMWSRIVYAVIGLAGVWGLSFLGSVAASVAARSKRLSSRPQDWGLFKVCLRRFSL